MATSVQLSQPPQATGTAAMSARKGMTTNAQSATRMLVGCRPSVSGFGPVWVVGGSRTARDMATPHGSTNYAYVTVAYGGGYASRAEANIRYGVSARDPGSSNGRTRGFGPRCRGSNPLPGAATPSAPSRSPPPDRARRSSTAG